MVTDPNDMAERHPATPATDAFVSAEFTGSELELATVGGSTGTTKPQDRGNSSLADHPMIAALRREA